MSKILVIEDDASVRSSTIDLLKMEGFEVLTAENGMIGIGMALKELPDLIICDIMMPELDGYGVLGLLHQDPRTSTIPLIFLTAKADREDIRYGMGMGADDYIIKPFSCKELLDGIATRLNRRSVTVNQFQNKLEDLRQNLARPLPQEFINLLSVILRSSEFLLDPQKSPDQYNVMKMAERIHGAGDRLGSLIQKFFVYTQLELIGTSPTEIQALRNDQTSSVKELISNVALQKAKQMGRTEDLILELQDTTARISPTNLEILVSELIDNAFRYSLPGTSVRVINVPNQKSLVLYIMDNGAGVAPQYIANLTVYLELERKPYEQQGIGLGLTIAKRLAELHCGELNLESVPGQKTIVRVALPH
jgi:CheY-like chemotaxis protein